MGLLGSILGIAAAPFTGGASLVPALAGAGLGAAKHFAVDAPAEKRSRAMNAEIMRYSPWTKMQAPGVKEAPGLFKSALQGGSMGMTAAGGLAKMAGAAAGAPGVAEAKNLAGGQFNQLQDLPSPQLGVQKPWLDIAPQGGGTGYDRFKMPQQGQGMLR